MGLLPTGTGDWLAFETRGSVSAHSLDLVLAHTTLVAARDTLTLGLLNEYIL